MWEGGLSEQEDDVLFQTEQWEWGESRQQEGGEAPASPGEVLSPVSPGVAEADPHHGRLGVAQRPHTGLALNLQRPGEDLASEQDWDGGPGDRSSVGERVDGSHVGDHRRAVV